MNICSSGLTNVVCKVVGDRHCEFRNRVNSQCRGSQPHPVPTAGGRSLTRKKLRSSGSCWNRAPHCDSATRSLRLSSPFLSSQTESTRQHKQLKPTRPATLHYLRSLEHIRHNGTSRMRGLGDGRRLGRGEGKQMDSFIQLRLPTDTVGLSTTPHLWTSTLLWKSIMLTSLRIIGHLNPLHPRPRAPPRPRPRPAHQG